MRIIYSQICFFFGRILSWIWTCMIVEWYITYLSTFLRNTIFFCKRVNISNWRQLWITYHCGNKTYWTKQMRWARILQVKSCVWEESGLYYLAKEPHILTLPACSRNPCHLWCHAGRTDPVSPSPSQPNIIHREKFPSILCIMKQHIWQTWNPQV